MKLTDRSLSFLAIIYDTINGLHQGFDSFIVAPTFLPQYVAGVLTSAQVTMFNAFLDPGDQGDYYCNFITGNGLAQSDTDTWASSPVFSLTLNLARFNKAGRTVNAWKAKYPILIASAAKIFL